jgi:hypothetical protein
LWRTGDDLDRLQPNFDILGADGILFTYLFDSSEHVAIFDELVPVALRHGKSDQRKGCNVAPEDELPGLLQQMELLTNQKKCG